MKRFFATDPTVRIAFFVLLLFAFAFAHAQPTADFAMNKAGGCSPLSVGFTNLSSASAAARYHWDFGNGNSSALKSPSAIYLTEATYTVTLTVTDGGQTATKTRTLTVYKKPVVNFAPTKPKVCLPEAVQFTSTSTAGDGSISNQQWDFGDGLTQTGFGNTVAHNYLYEIVPAVTLTVTNSFGCVASTTKTNAVEVLPKIEPLFTVNKTLLCNLGDSIQLTNNSTGPGTLQYLWDFGDGTTSTEKSPVHRFARNGVFGVRLTVSNTVGCSVTSAPVSVNAAFFQTDFSVQTLCRQANFTGSAYLFPSSSQWNFGNGSFSSHYPNASHTYAAGSYDVTLINTYNGVCKDTVTKTVSVQDLVAYNSTVNGPSAVCKGSTATFSNSSTVPPGTLRWDFGDGTGPFTTTQTTVNHTYAQAGTYTITLVNTFGTCSETVTKTVVVNDLPDTKGFVADFGGVCGAPVTVAFRDTTPGAVSWRWYLNATWTTPFSTAQNPSYNFTSNGTYYVYLTVTNAAGCTTTVSKTVVVSQPSANVYIAQSSSPRGHYDCDSLTLTFGVNSSHTLRSYSWNFGNGVTSTLASPKVHYDRVGVYNVVLTYVTESGCTGTAVFTARVYDKPQANFSYNVPCGASLTLGFTDTSPFSDQWNWQFGDGGSAFWVNPDHSYRDTGIYTVRFINAIGRCRDTVYKQVHAYLLPSSVSITKAQNTCEGTRGTVTFDQRSVRCSGGTWDFGDGTVIPYDSSNHNISHTYAATGTYTVRLTSGYRACTYTATQTVYVLLKQNPTLTVSPTQLCASASANVQIGGLVTNPFLASSSWYQYSLSGFQYNDGTMFSGSVSSVNGFNPITYSGTLSNFAAGTTAIRAIVTAGGSGCQDTTNFISLQVNGPIAGFRMTNNNGCYKTPFVFTDTSRSATAVALTRWRWEFGDGFTVDNTTAAPVAHRYNLPGTYLVRLTVTDATGCSKTVTATASARGPRAAFTTSGLFVPNVPLNTTVNFFNNSSNNSLVPVNYTWHYGNGSTSTAYSGSHTYTVAGTYTVMLVANDPSIGCADTVTQLIYVKDFNTAFAFTKTYLGEGSCPPVLVRINNLSVGFTRLLWDFGDGTTSTQVYPSHTYPQPGLYRITLTTYGFNGLVGTYVDSIQVGRPSVSLSADVLKGCVSQGVNFTVNAQSASSYLWDLGDGSASTSAAGFAHTYLSPGLYNPRIVVKDSLGCQASAQLADTVVIDSLNIAIRGIPALVCDSALIPFAPDVQSFAATRLGTALQYKWDFGTGNAADTSNLRNPSFRYTAPGTYMVTFTVTSPYGCRKQTTATFTVHQKAKGRVTALAESCEQAAVQFSGTATPADGVQWAWNFANGNTSASASPTPQVYNTPGTYLVTLVLTRNGCSDTTVHQLTVHPKPIVNALPRQAVLCLGDSSRLSANGGGTYAWLPAEGLSNAAIASPMASPRQSIRYRVQVTSNKGCTATDSVNITVAQPIDVTVTGDATLCKGEESQLTASGAASYQWINNLAGLSNASAANPLARPLATTTYTVVGSDVHGCFKDTAAVTLTVHDLPAVNAGPDIEIVAGTSYVLNAAGSADVTAWLWAPGTALNCTACPAPVATPKMETAYTVTVRNAWGCTATDAVVLKLQCAADKVYIPDAFTPNNDGKNDLFYVSGSGIKIIRYLRIYDRWGGLVYEKTNGSLDDKASAWDGRVNGQPVATGSYVYLAELECSSGERFVRKGTVTLIR